MAVPRTFARINPDPEQASTPIHAQPVAVSGISVALWRRSYARSPLWKADEHPTHPTGARNLAPDRHVRSLSLAVWNAVPSRHPHVAERSDRFDAPRVQLGR